MSQAVARCFNSLTPPIHLDWRSISLKKIAQCLASVSAFAQEQLQPRVTRASVGRKSLFQDFKVSRLQPCLRRIVEGTQAHRPMRGIQ